MSGAPPPPQGVFKRRVVAPILAQLRQGITPEKIALTLALGGTVALFPILGSTSILCGIVAVVFRLNQPIIQLTNWICYPLQFVLLLPLYRAGEYLGAPHLSLSISQLTARFQAGPWQFVKDFGLVALGGVGVWCILAPPVIAILYFVLRTPLRRLAEGVTRVRGS